MYTNEEYFTRKIINWTEKKTCQADQTNAPFEQFRYEPTHCSNGSEIIPTLKIPRFPLFSDDT